MSGSVSIPALTNPSVEKYRHPGGLSGGGRQKSLEIERLKILHKQVCCTAACIEEELTGSKVTACDVDGDTPYNRLTDEQAWAKLEEAILCEFCRIRDLAKK